MKVPRVLDDHDRSLLIGFGLLALFTSIAILGVALVAGLAVRVFLILAGLS